MRRPDTSGKVVPGACAATGNARSPSVDRRVDGTTSVDALADLRRLRASTSVVKMVNITVRDRTYTIALRESTAIIFVKFPFFSINKTSISPDASRT